MNSDKTIVLQTLLEVAKGEVRSTSPGSTASESVPASRSSPVEAVNPPSRGRKLDAVLPRISPDNLHGRVDFGAPAGREPL